ncbi:sulfurtransferase [Microbulbifer agarilyticus]|uniref:sulfurtransferase n=1 Tax=Microbulbifer agarilyticus TaxID=260552 RepID=UPI001C94BDC8|nr:rhodanese-like domain-containing protein [Microbulbifer agarilyticus]MBY6209963.1 sulfurtransferase [Microbulbifer agarilyticus]
MSDIPLILEPEQLASLLEHKEIRVIDLSSPQNYLAGHIPGALGLPFQALMAGTPPAPGKLPSIERLTQVMQAIGLTPDTHIVACDDEGGGWAGRLLWTLEVIGHTKYSYLNGGMTAWKNAGLPLTTEDATVTPSSITVSIADDAPMIDAEQIQQRLGQNDLQIWDARSPLEYSGERMVAMRGGHIPGAINCEWTQLMDPQRDLRIREDAKEFLTALGIDGSKEIATHCQSHHRSAFTWLVGKSLGLPIKAYPGSWSEWGNLSDTPIES